MAKKQTFQDKIERVRSHGGLHCPVCDDVFQATKVRKFQNEGGRLKLVTKSVKVCKCNISSIFG